MAVIIYNDIPASDEELEKNEPLQFTISGYEFYRFKMNGLSLVEFYLADRILKIALFWTLNKELTKTELAKILHKAIQRLKTFKIVIDLITFIYEKIIPIPLHISWMCLGKHNLKYWRYPKKWIFNMKDFLEKNIQVDELGELSHKYLEYTIKIKKKLENILQIQMDSTINTKDDLKTLQQLLPAECAPVFLSAGAQVFGQQGA